MLWVKLFVEKINPQSDKFATGVGNKGTGDSKRNDSPKNIFHFILKLKIGMQQEIFGVKKKDKLNGVWKQTRHEVTQNFLQLTLKLHIPKNYKTNAIIIKAKDWKYKTDNCTYYITSSASRQDELNRALFLATQVGKMEPSCPLGTTHCIPQAKFHQKPYNKPFIDHVCSVKMAGYWPRPFLQVYGPRLRLGPKTHTQKTWPISSHLDHTLGQ